MMTAAILFIVCLFLSAYFSGAEMAYVSSNKLKIRELADSGNRRAQKVLRLQEQPQRFLAGILLGNNIVNIVATALVTYWLEERFGIANGWVVTAITAPLLIVFGETVPKDYGRLRAHHFLLKYAPSLAFLLKIFSWPIQLVLDAIQFFLGPLGEGFHRSIFVSEKEFRLVIEESTRAGVLAHHEKQLIDTILDFETIDVESVMMTSEKIAKVEFTENVGKAREIARQTNSPILFVYEEIPSIVVGMIYVFDILFEAREDEGLKKYLRSPIFLFKNTSIEKAFLMLQEKRQSFAAVTDLYGEVIGVVAIERLFAL